MVKDNGYIYFIRYLESTDPGILPDSRAQAAFVLATVCEAGVKGQGLCMAANLVNVLCGRLQGAATGEAASSPLLTRWLCLCLGQLIRDLPEVLLPSPSPSPLSICEEGLRHPVHADDVTGVRISWVQ